MRSYFIEYETLSGEIARTAARVAPRVGHVGGAVVSWIIRKQTGEPVYAAVLEGKRVGWGSEKAARARLAELELYYMWPFDAVVEDVRDDVEADGAS